MKPAFRNKLIEILLALLFVTGLAVALYLMFIHYFPQQPGTMLYKMCTMGQKTNCGLVNTSTYSEFLGVPLGGWGAFLYASLLLLLFYMKVMDKEYAVTLKPVIFIAGLAAVLVSIPLAVISAVLLNTFCTLCALLWMINVAILLLSLWWITASSRDEGVVEGSSFSQVRELLLCPVVKALLTFRRSSIIAVNVLLVLVTVLAINDSLESQKELSNTLAQKHAEEQLLRRYGSFPLVDVNISRVPLFAGNRNAAVEIVVYFDFNCGVCHKTILMMEDMVKEYPGQLALYLKQFPLDGRCNPSMRESDSGKSCEGARAAISLYNEPGYIAFVKKLLSHEGLVDMEAIRKACENAGLSWNTMRQEIDDQKTAVILGDEVAEALSMDINATPTIVINRKKLPAGMPPAHLLHKLIQLEIGNSATVK